MEVIGITSGRPPSVVRPQGSKSLFLTLDGLRDANVRDRSEVISRFRLQALAAVDGQRTKDDTGAEASAWSPMEMTHEHLTRPS